MSPSSYYKNKKGTSCQFDRRAILSSTRRGTHSLHESVRESLVDLDVVVPVGGLVLADGRVVKRGPKDLLAEDIV